MACKAGKSLEGPSAFGTYLRRGPTQRLLNRVHHDLRLLQFLADLPQRIRKIHSKARGERNPVERNPVSHPDKIFPARHFPHLLAEFPQRFHGQLETNLDVAVVDRFEAGQVL